MSKKPTDAGIANSNVIYASHVKQFADALAGNDAYDIAISGSLNVTGSQTVSKDLTVAGTGSFGYLVNASVVASQSLTSISASYAETYKITDQINTFYVAKSGDNLNSGLNVENAVQTFGKAIDLVSNGSPSANNQYSIQCLDSGIYIENFTIPVYTEIVGVATISGSVILNDNSSIRVHKIETSANVANAVSKNTGSSYSFVYADEILVTGTGSNAILNAIDSSILHIHANVIHVQGSGSRGIVSYITNGHIHLHVGDIYLEQASTVGIFNVLGYIVGSVDHILPHGNFENRIGLYASNQSTSSLEIGEIKTEIPYNINNSQLNLISSKILNLEAGVNTNGDLNLITPGHISASYSDFAVTASYAENAAFPSGIISSSAQISTEISGAFYAASSSLADRLTTEEAETSYWTGSAGEIHATNVKVGIGTTTPGNKLHVESGSVLFDGANLAGPVLSIKSSKPYGMGIVLERDRGGSVGSMQIYPYNDAAGALFIFGNTGSINFTNNGSPRQFTAGSSGRGSGMLSAEAASHGMNFRFGSAAGGTDKNVINTFTIDSHQRVTNKVHSARLGLHLAVPVYSIDVAAPFSQSAGTVDFDSSGGVTGSGTSFTTDLKVGDYITIRRQENRVASIQDDTHLKGETTFFQTATSEDMYYTHRVFAVDDIGNILLNPDSGSFNLTNGQGVMHWNDTGSIGIGVSGSDIDAKVHIYSSDTGSRAFLIEGQNGTLFQVIDDMSGSLFGVTDISGLPILEVFSDDKVVMGKYGENTLVVTGSEIFTADQKGLDVTMNITGSDGTHNLTFTNGILTGYTIS